MYDPEAQTIHGYIHMKELARVLHSGTPVQTLDPMIRNPTIVPESLPADRIRQRMQNTHTHLAFVVDEFGDFAGIITMEDILEEIVGQIQDEMDREFPDVTQLGRETWLVDGGFCWRGQKETSALNSNPTPTEWIPSRDTSSRDWDGWRGREIPCGQVTTICGW